jgi:O-methyltransferase
MLWKRENTLPAQHVPHVFDCRPEAQKRFAEVYESYARHHGKPSDPMRVLHFMNLLEAANTLDPGDYIELGVLSGLTLKLIRTLMDQNRMLYGLDTFTGFDQRDVDAERRLYADNGTQYGFGEVTIDGVARFVGGTNVKLIKGWFPESFASLESLRWRFVHIDFDLYEPTKQAMRRLWPALVPGGVMLVHDYGCLGFPGIKIAVDEFSAETGVYPVQLFDTWGSVVFRKHNH